MTDFALLGRRSVALSMVLAFAGCPPASPIDAGAGDAGRMAADAGSAHDSGVPTDAGSAGTNDAGSLAPNDAGAAVANDAGAAGANDAGAAVANDAGAAVANDAGAVVANDAGAAVANDAGAAVANDAGAVGADDAGAQSGVDAGSAFCPGVLNGAGAVLGSHCQGTNHQDITGIERVVFVGDSITVGSPPTASADCYRSRLADTLAGRFSLTAPSALWKTANPLEGMSAIQDSGDFASCAEWGARTDDLMQDDNQITDCLPENERHKRTLVVMTMGGNDILKVSENKVDGATPDEVFALLENQVQLLGDTLEWLREPGRFPNGVFVIFANNYEFTDRTGDTTLCPGAGSAGYDANWAAASDLVSHVAYANLRYLELAVTHQVDMVFLEETFCGHGFGNGEAGGACFAPGAPLWFDLTCIHPNAAGHVGIHDLMLSVIDE